MTSSTENDSLKSKTVKGILWGGLSSGIQQLIGFIFGIFLARILSRYDYGLLATITIFSVLASAFQESGFVNGLSNKRTVEHKDYNAVFWTSVTIGSILYLILFFSAPLIAHFFEQPKLINLSRVVFLGFWISSFGIAHNAFLFRNLMIKERAISTNLALIVSNVIGLFLALKGYGYWSLAVQTVLYSLVVNIMFIYFSTFRPTLSYNLRPILDIYGFSVKILITNTFIHINNNVYGFIFAKFYPIEQVGDVNQANKWNIMSQSVIGNIVSYLTQPVLRKVYDDESRLLRVFRKLLSFTAFLTFPTLFCLALVSRDFIFITIGPKWEDSASYLGILAVGGAFTTVSTVFSNLILSFGKSKIYMWNIIGFGILQILILWNGLSLGIPIVLVMTSLLGILWTFVWFFRCRKLLKYTLQQLFQDVFSYCLLALISIVIAYISILYIQNIYIRFASAFSIVIVSYTFLSYLFKPLILNEISTYLKDMKNK